LTTDITDIMNTQHTHGHVGQIIHVPLSLHT